MLGPLLLHLLARATTMTHVRSVPCIVIPICRIVLCAYTLDSLASTGDLVVSRSLDDLNTVP